MKLWRCRVTRFECLHAELGEPFLLTGSAWDGLDLFVAGLCRQCRADLCCHPLAEPRGIGDVILGYFEVECAPLTEQSLMEAADKIRSWT